MPVADETQTTRPPHDVAHLIGLIQAAAAEARRLDLSGSVGRGLDDALTAARALLGRAGHPDQGVRLQDLTTANDG